MGKKKEVPFEVLKDAIGDELFEKHNSYVFEYFDLLDSDYGETIALSIVRDDDGSFCVFEDEKGFLLTTIRKSDRNRYMVIPSGLLRVLAFRILNDSKGSRTRGKNNVYDRITDTMRDTMEEDTGDGYIYFVSILLTDIYNFDLDISTISSLKSTSLYVTGKKQEFYYLDNEHRDIYHSWVRYNVSVYRNREKIKIIKNYMSDAALDVKFEIGIDELVECAVNEFRASKT